MIAPETMTFTGAEGNALVADCWNGHGRPVILLHGGGQTRHAWEATAGRLAENGMRAITVDQRGHGESAWVESQNYAFAHFADDLVAVVREVEAFTRARPSVVGASLGGLAGLLAQSRYEGLLESLVLVDVTPRMNAEGVSKVQGFMGERMEKGFASLGEAAEAIASYLPHRKRPRSLDGLKKNLRLGADGRYRWHWDPAFIGGATNINTGARELLDELMAALPRLRPPVLLVRGMQSELVHEAHAREFVDLMPSASYVDVGGAGHMVAGDRNDVFGDAILQFLGDRQAA